MVAGDGPSLMVHDWLSHIKLDWPRLNHVQGVAISLPADFEQT